MLGDLGSSTAAVQPFGTQMEGGSRDGLNSGEGDRNNYGGNGGGGGGGGGGEEFGDKSFGGNRWPRQETLALLKIRSEMDVAFRDASVKGPLWDEVSRKLAELGFHRSAKKCKEKFDNVYKYHRRTKEGRTGKSDGKTYRFFDQLEVLENQPPMPTTPNSSSTHQSRPQSTMAMQVSIPPTHLPSVSHVINTNSNIVTPAVPNSSFTSTNTIIFPPPQRQQNPTSHQQQTTFVVPPSTISSMDHLMSNSTSLSTSSDDEMEGRARRKRKWKDFFETLMKEVVHKQEDLQKRILDAIEKREQDRMAREEAWKMQETARINREREIHAQERSVTAAKDAAVLSFLQKISSEDHHHQSTPTNHNSHLLMSQPSQPQTQPPPAQPSTAPPPAHLQIAQVSPITNFEITPTANGNSNLVSPTSCTAASSSRWPKMEVHALIKLRTSMDSKYQENGAKGPLWEEISAEMKKLGYNRSAKRCKEKWENINKYFKKVKESNKKRPEDSKTCPYFHLLDSLYRERNNHVIATNNNILPETANAAPLMVRPEQQWQPPNRVEEATEQNRDDENDEDEDEEEDDEDEDEGNYEIVANKGADSVSVSVEAATAAAE